MLAIRLQRLGRSGYPTYRLAVQEVQRHPLSGRVVAYVGSYNPHTKETRIDAEKVQKYLDNGAQPTDRVVKLLKEIKEIKLPSWVKTERTQKTKAIRHPEKLRKNRPQELAESAPETAAEAVEPVEETEA